MSTEYGDRTTTLTNEILRTTVGSAVLGLAIPGTEDHDEMGVFVEPATTVLGLEDPLPHYVFRTQPEGTRSAPGDTDLILYSLRKYLRLVVKGNPTALLPLHAPAESVLKLTPLGERLRALTPALLSQEAVHRFLGYMNAQRDRLLGRGRQSDVPDRPELVAVHGYDVKYASHALRLAYQGLELVTRGRLTLPMPEFERERALRVKRGDEPDLAAVLAEVADVQARIEAALAAGDTPLRPTPDLAAISAWSAEAHQGHWTGTPDPSRAMSPA